jgi:N utilization substance protein B
MAANVRDESFWDGPTQEPLAPRVGKLSRPGRNKAEPGERVETRGRARALQALYAADLRDMANLRRIATNVPG